MFLFNFKLFLKIAAAILGGSSLTANGNLNIDTVSNTEPKMIKTEIVNNSEGEVSAFKTIQMNEQLLDSLKIEVHPTLIEEGI
jgi:hypothetical protein